MKPKSLASRLFDRNAAAAAKILNVGGAKYQMHVDCVDQTETPDHEHGKQVVVDCRQKEKSPKEVHFAFLQEKYEPLKEDEARAKAKEEKKQKKKESYKKMKKNVGKALRYSWKCLVIGLYNISLGYSTPITVAASFAPDFHQSRDRT
ncbi:uncharacterized protein C1orf115 [Acanthochromis polyacanthus]|uniref:uncharacterized protein C1orf115 n=1 Tax=Acanthochromis polyacanthus TaxID=80966 RepID=UPI000B8FC1A3|nr:uncharacterized protein C1orf115 [Acanthochromis polyacanthus]